MLTDAVRYPAEMHSTQTALQAIWQRQLPQLRERLHLLARAAEELSTTRTIDADLRAEALDVAHKLAGSLGMFGYSESTAQARLVEETLEHAGLPQPERLQKHVDDLHASLAGVV